MILAFEANSAVSFKITYTFLEFSPFCMGFRPTHHDLERSERLQIVTWPYVPGTYEILPSNVIGVEYFVDIYYSRGIYLSMYTMYDFYDSSDIFGKSCNAQMLHTSGV